MKLSLFLAVAILAGATSSRAATPADPAASAATHAYEKLCQKVIDKKLAPLKLPDIPDNYDDQYLTEEEKDVVDKATTKKYAAMMTSPLTV